MSTDELQNDRISLFRHALVLSALLALLGLISAQNGAPRQSPILVNMSDIYYNL